MTDLPATRSEGDATTVDPAKVAFTLEQAILQNATRIAEDTWELAADLYHFHEIGGWSLCGYDTLEEFLARPELGLSRSQFFRMTKAYRDLVVVRSIDVEELKQIEPSKVHEVIPAIMRGDVGPDKALSDAKALGRRDLREKYRKGDKKEGIKPSGKPALPEDDLHGEDPVELVACPHCGTLVDPALLDDEPIEPAAIEDDEPPVIDVEPVAESVDPTPEAHSDAGEVEEATGEEGDVDEGPDEQVSVNEEAYAIRAATRTLAGVVEGTAVIAGVGVGGALKELRKRAGRNDGDAVSALKALGLAA